MLGGGCTRKRRRSHAAGRRPVVARPFHLYGAVIARREDVIRLLLPLHQGPNRPREAVLHCRHLGFADLLHRVSVPLVPHPQTTPTPTTRQRDSDPATRCGTTKHGTEETNEAKRQKN